MAQLEGWRLPVLLATCGLLVRTASLLGTGLLSARPQSDSPAPGPALLDSKAATKLALSRPQPEYPAIAKQNFIQGRVRLQIHVGREGEVLSAHVVSGHPFLAASALKTVRHWRFRPFIAVSGPSDFLTPEEVKFILHTKRMKSVPSQPEKDLMRQVRPPEIIDESGPQEGSVSVHMKILVDATGKVIDSEATSGPASQFEAARKEVEGWTFRPARWGTLSVPWYLEVEVPLKGLKNLKSKSAASRRSKNYDSVRYFEFRLDAVIERFLLFWG